MPDRYEGAALAAIIVGIQDRFPIPGVAERAGVKLKSAGNEWTGCCPFHEDRTPSFTIYDGDRRWHCFGCGKSGDVLDFVQLAYRVKLLEAVDMLDGGALAELEQQQAPRKPGKDMSEVVKRIVASAVNVSGTPGEAYLRRRGITMPLPPSLRFARLAPPKESGLLVANGAAAMPVLIAVVTDPAGQLVGIQRTYVTEDGRKAASADGKVKFSLGSVAGGAIHLGPAAASILVTEGLEDGLTLAQALGRTVWVSAGTSMLPRMELPDVVRSVVIGADADAAGERAAQKAAAVFLDSDPKRNVRIMRPAGGYKDFNAELMGPGS